MALSLPVLKPKPKKKLKISHQFPDSTLTQGDFRNRLCQRFAAEVEKRTGGALKSSLYAGSSLMKTNAQFSSMRKGAHDMSLVPLSCAGGEAAETNTGLMPAPVPGYEQGSAWKTAEVGKFLAKVLNEIGIIIVTWVWRASGVSSKSRQLVFPFDSKGLKVRGGSREMVMMLKLAGVSVITLSSNEIYASMQTGVIDAAMTADTSFISFKLEEIAKHLTSGRARTFWFRFEPLMMSKGVFSKLPKSQHDVVMAVGAELEVFARDAARADDKIAADIYAKAGAKVCDMAEVTLKQWQVIARETAWKDFAENSESCASLLKAAQKLV